VIIDSAQLTRPQRDRVVALRLPRVGFSARVDPRAIVVTLAFLAVAVAAFCWSLSVGDYPVPMSEVIATLLGGGTEENAFIVRTLRLPRGLTALLVGAAFGVSGAILQRLARNPLASPDIVGVNAGACVAAVFVIVIVHGSPVQITTGALAGALVASLAVYLLAYKRGVTGYRYVLVGIGLTAVLNAGTHYLLTRAQIYDAQRATVWLTGSLNGRGWEQVRQIGVALAVLLPVALALGRSLRLLDLGDDAARGLGGHIERSRVALMLVAVGLAAVGTAAAGPIGFIALVSPQIARRVAGTRSVGLLPSAACGAMLLITSDLVARRMFAPTELPVGVITAIIGAPYLLYLLARANKIGHGG
jgi:iron complex transport system permease protein